MQDSDPIATAQQAHRDIDRAPQLAAVSRLSGNRTHAGNVTVTRHARPYGTPLDIYTGKARPQRIDPLGDPSDYERPDAKTIAAGIAITTIAGLLVAVIGYATFAGWAGPL